MKTCCADCRRHESPSSDLTLCPPQGAARRNRGGKEMRYFSRRLGPINFLDWEMRRRSNCTRNQCAHTTTQILQVQGLGQDLFESTNGLHKRRKEHPRQTLHLAAIPGDFARQLALPFGETWAKRCQLVPRQPVPEAPGEAGAEPLPQPQASLRRSGQGSRDEWQAPGGRCGSPAPGRSPPARRG